MADDKRPSLSFNFAGEFRFGAGRFGEVIALDAVVSQRHQLEADVTENPVETGAPVADHSRPKQESLTLEALVSNHQLALPPERQDPPGTRVPRVLATLIRLRDTGTLVKFESERRTVDNLVVNSLQFAFETQGETLRFTLGMRQVRFVDTTTVAIEKKKRTLILKGQLKRKEGPKPTQVEESLLLVGVDRVSGGKGTALWNELDGRKRAREQVSVSGVGF